MRRRIAGHRGLLVIAAAYSVLAARAPESERLRAEPNEPAAPSATRATAGQASTGSGRLIVLKRQPLRLVLPDRFDVHPQLQPRRRTVLRAEVRGRIVSIAAQPGERLSAEQTILQIDSPAYLLQERIARQRLAVFQAELEQAKAAGDSGRERLAQLRVELARLELEQAEATARKTTVRTPYAATVTDIRVEVGDYVEPGTPLAEVADFTALMVNVPVRADETKSGERMALQVDTEQVTGVIRAIVPLADRYAPLHALQIRLASALVDIDNGSGRLMPGWVVGVPLLPDAPVVQVPLVAVSSDEQGRRHVFVLRDNQIRRVDVRLLGQRGTESVYVSGNFASDDELITSSSVELTDGTIVRRASGPEVSAHAENAPAETPRRTVTPETPNASKKKVGF